MLTTVYTCIAERHDLRLVVLAGALCLFACLAAVNLFIRADEAVGRRRLLWLGAAAMVFGSGVWATHFVAELAYRPGIPVGYETVFTLLSIVVAMAATWIGMALALYWRQWAVGGGVVGAAVCAMHYTGMAAIRVPATLHWDGGLVFASLVIAVGLAAAAMRVLGGLKTRHRLAAALLLVLAICGLHFTAMAAVRLEYDPTVAVGGVIFDPAMLAVAIAAVTILIVSLGLSGAFVDRKMTLAATREAERLRRSREHLARAQRTARTGSIERDLRAGTVEWSDETFRIFGFDRADGVPNRDRLLDRVHPLDRAACVAAIANAEAGRGGASHDFRIVLPDGSVRWLHHESEVFHDEHGAPAWWIGTHSDVTAEREAEARQHALEAAVRAANEELEARVEERTLALQAAQAELVKATRVSTFGQITATVAHELRNPLGTIRNTLFTVRTLAGDDARYDRPITRMQKAIDRCNQIVTELHDFTFARELTCRPVALDDWLGEVIDQHKTPGGIAIERRFAAGTAAVSLDEARFRLALANVIVNAVQAVEAKESPRIAIATHLTDRVHIAVEDNGDGMSADILAEAFEPLFTTKSFGTGLGLPTVRLIVDQHGGTVAIDTEVGRGTRVEISLPRAAAVSLAA